MLPQPLPLTNTPHTASSSSPQIRTATTAGAASKSNARGAAGSGGGRRTAEAGSIRVVLQVLWTLVSGLSLAAECLQLIDGMYAGMHACAVCVSYVCRHGCVCCLRMVCMQAWIRVLPAYRCLHTCKPCMLRLAYVYEMHVKACIRLSCIRIRDACQGEMDVKVCIRLCRASQGLHTYMPFIFRPMHATASSSSSSGSSSSTHTRARTHTHTHTGLLCTMFALPAADAAAAAAAMPSKTHVLAGLM